jgi:signal transduction histidine kinase
VKELEERGGWPSLIHPEDLPYLLSRVKEILLGQGETNEVRIITKQGEVRWIRYLTHPVWNSEKTRVVRLLGSVQDITQLKHDEEEIKTSANKLKSLSRRLLEVQEQERRHLARELHDEIGQVLTGLKFSLEMCRGLPQEHWLNHLEKAQQMVSDLTHRVRDLSMGLRPSHLDDLGLLAALLWHFQRYSAQSQIQVHLDHSGLESPLGADLETAAYRIVQEALTNVARHAKVSEVHVRLWNQDGILGIQVEDKGFGFDVEKIKRNHTTSGLSGLEERVHLLGGRLHIESSPGTGTCLTAEIPLATEDLGNDSDTLPRR